MDRFASLIHKWLHPSTRAAVTATVLSLIVLIFLSLTLIKISHGRSSTHGVVAAGGARGNGPSETVPSSNPSPTSRPTGSLPAGAVPATKHPPLATGPRGTGNAPVLPGINVHETTCPVGGVTLNVVEPYTNNGPFSSIYRMTTEVTIEDSTQNYDTLYAGALRDDSSMGVAIFSQHTMDPCAHPDRANNNPLPPVTIANAGPLTIQHLLQGGSAEVISANGGAFSADLVSAQLLPCSGACGKP